jgi:hypothetical protein
MLVDEGQTGPLFPEIEQTAFVFTLNVKNVEELTHPFAFVTVNVPV